MGILKENTTKRGRKKETQTDRQDIKLGTKKKRKREESKRKKLTFLCNVLPGEKGDEREGWRRERKRGVGLSSIRQENRYDHILCLQ